MLMRCTLPEHAPAPLPWATQLALARTHARAVCPAAVLETVRGGNYLPESPHGEPPDLIRMTFNFRCPGQWIHVQFDDTHQHIEVLSSRPFDREEWHGDHPRWSQQQLDIVEQHVALSPRQAIQLTLDAGNQFAETYAQQRADVEVTASLDVAEDLEDVIGTPAAWNVFYRTRVNGERKVLLITVDARNGQVLRTYSE